MFRKLLEMILIVGSIILSSGLSLASVPSVGDRAPDFTLSSVAGERVTLSQYQGSVVVLGLFHICDPCMNQAIEFQKVINEGKSKAVFIGVNTMGDTQGDLLEYLNQFKDNVTFPYLLDPDRSVDRVYNQRFMPTVIVIDEKGIIRFRGSTTLKNSLIKIIDRL